MREVKGISVRIPLALVFLALGCSPLSAQTPAPSAAAPPQVQNDDLGFSYGLPPDWDFVAPPPPPPPGPYPDLPPPAKKGNACVQIALTARHGTPASVVVVIELPFDCYGQAMTASDLPGFGSGAQEGLKEAFEIADPIYGNYPLGSHNLWIERATGTPKGHPQPPYTFEIACTLLKKGAVCWMTMAADAESLKAFEQQAVTLEGDAFGALVPAGYVDLAPSAKPSKPS